MEENESQTSQNKLTIDEILEQSVGPFGRWQLKVSILVSLIKFPIAWLQFGILFLAPPTKFWCTKPREFVNMTLEKWTEESKSLIQGSCYLPDLFSNKSIVKCQWGYEYNTTVFLSSIITEWDLVCGREYLVDIAQMIFMFGVLIGTFCFGILSDRFGRKTILIICLIIQAIAGGISALLLNFYLFLFARFITAFANAGTMVASFVICMEIVGGKWRAIIPILYQIPFGIGYSLMGILAYFIRDWRQLQLILSGFSIIFIIYWFILPESPRWLLATGRYKKAKKLLEDATKNNKKLEINKTKKMLSLINKKTLNVTESKPNIFLLFRNPILRKNTILLNVHWLLSGVSFYGFSQYTGQISNQFHLTVIISGLISIPGTILCCFLTKKYGRKRTITIAHIFTAICYFSILSIPKEKHTGDWPRIILTAFGVVGLSISTPALYLFTGEIYPTVLRNAGVGMTLTFSRIGSMIAPFINGLSRFTLWLPLVTLGVCSLGEALLTLPLPETNNLVLTDTIPDIELLEIQGKRYQKVFKNESDNNI